MSTENKKLIEAFEAMETTEKWEKYVRAKNELLRGQINKEKAEKFADYLIQRFLDACNDKTVFGSFVNWNNKTTDEKISITDKIVKAFLQNIKFDILNDKVELHNRDGSKYVKTNDIIDKGFRENIISCIPNITVQNKDIPETLMGITRTGNLYINVSNVFYQNTPLFFLMDLKHELTHIVDTYIQAISILDPTVNEESQMFYIDPKRDRDLYHDNPLELNANQKRKDLRIKIQQMLKFQESAIVTQNNIGEYKQI